MALALDGHAGNASNSTTQSASLTTTSADDIIIAVCTNFSNQTSTQNGIQGVSGGGLTWACRSRQQITTTVSSFIMYVETWVAHAPTALVSQTITATAGAQGSVNYFSLELFAVSGADLDNIFDTNAALPASSAIAGSGGTSSHPVSGISTTNANTFEFAALATELGGSGSAAADSGFSLLDNLWANASFGSLQTEYKINSSGVSSVSQNVFSSVSTVSTNYIALVDAIMAAGATRSGPVFVNSGGGITNIATSLTPSLPGSRVNNNMLLAHCSITSSTASPTWSSGWNVIETWTIGTQIGTKAWRYVTGSETAPTIDWTPDGTRACMAQVVQISGVDQTSPIGSSSHNSASSSSVTCSVVTTTRNNSLVVNYLDVGTTYRPEIAPRPWRPRSSGASITGSANGSWQVSDEFLATSGAASDSVGITLQASNPWLNFTTEILAPLSAPSLPPSALVFV